ncbi:MAG: DUF6711 family protein, partial [Bacillota bacterium]
DGSVIPPPSGYTFTEADLTENSKRNAQGVASWDVVRQNVGNLDLTWENIDGDRLKQVVAAIRGKKSFAVTFFNPLTGNHETRTFYAGDRSAQLARYVSAVKYWASLTVPFVEV